MFEQYTRRLETERQDARGMLVRTPRGALHVVIEGSGPDVVMIHGVTDNSAVWAGIQRELAGVARTHAIDLPGHGLSDIPLSPLSVAAMADAVIAYMDMENIRGAVVVGNSLGGGVSLGIAARAKHRVRSVILLGSIGTHFPIPPGLGLLRVLGVAETMAAISRNPSMRRFVMRDLWHKSFVPSEEQLEHYWRGWRVGGRARYIRALMRVMNVAEPGPWLASIEAPVHVIHGDRDRIIPVRVAHELASAIRGATIEILPATGHEPQIERPRETIAAIRRALATSSPRAHV